MAQLIAQRIAAMVVLSLALTAVVFGLQQVSPLDPVHAMLGANASPSAIAQQRHALGLDQPLPNQFWHYLTGVVHGDLGHSFRTRRPVSEDLASFVPATTELAVTALVLAVLLAVVLAFSASLTWPGGAVVRLLLIGGASAPAFLIGIGAVLVFYSQLGWLPASGRTDLMNAPTGPTGLLTLDGLIAGRPDVTLDAVKHLLLPALAIAFGPAVAVGRVLRSSLLGEQAGEYARTARAKGLTESQVLTRH